MNKASIMLLLVSIVFCAVGVPEAVAQGENYVVRVAEDGERYNYTVRIVDSQLITVTNAAKLILEGLPDAVTLTEVTYLDGATGPLQTQIDGKQDVVGGVSSAEIGYLDGVTSALQTQIDTKQAYGTRVVLVDCNLAADVTGKAYNTVAEAIAYAATQSPAAANPWLVQIMPGDYVEAVTCSAYVDVEGIGDVEIRTSGANIKVCTLASNVTITNITARATAGEGLGYGIHAFTAAASVTGVSLINCRGYIDAACTGCQSGLGMGAAGVTIDGEIRDCDFQTGNVGISVACATQLRIWNTSAIGVQDMEDVGHGCGLVFKGGGGTLQIYGSRFDGQMMTYTTTNAYSISILNTAGIEGIVELYNCNLNAYGDATQSLAAVNLLEAADATLVCRMYDCHIMASAAGAGTVIGVATGGAGTPVLTMVGGSIETSSVGGTEYDAEQTSGTLTLRDVSRSGVLSGTITKAGTVTASAFSGATGVFTASTNTPVIFPAADTVSAVQIRKANGTTSVIDVDTTNTRLGVGTTAPDQKIEINTGAATGGARIAYNDADGSASVYGDILIASDGDLDITATGGDISFDNENLLTTGTLGAGAITGTSLTSTAVSPAAPLTVASSVVVSGLNADLLDGLSSTAFVADTDYSAAEVILVGTGSATYGAVTLTASHVLGMAAAGNTASLGESDLEAILGDAVSDGTTKGVATFTAADFDDASGVISLAADVIRDADVDDVAVDAATTAPISSNWAFDHKYRVVNFVIDGGGYEIPTGIQGDIMIDHACTITSWTLLADQSGAIKVDIWEDVYDNFPPLGAGEDDSICNAHEPEIAASGVKAQDLDIADWSGEGLSAGSILRINVDSVTDITRCTLVLYLTED